MFADHYRKRRQKLAQQLEGGIALIHASGMSPDPMLRDKNLVYLTGVTDQKAHLLLAPNGVMVEGLETRTGPELMRGRKVHEILFVESHSEQDAFMDGPSPALDDILRATGVDRVYPLGRLIPTLQRALMTTDSLWLNTPRTLNWMHL
ncbi:MAG: aminopeptidase P N-terminal domain-containing protein [Anaerolineae bacterium]|nr:aminopeptidase P N-terminal domain-containing protein [Anaerolineae bacterium]